MPDLDIRRLNTEDAADFKSIRLAALRLAPEAFGTLFAEEAARPDSAFVERLTQSVFLGAYLDSRVVGMVGLVCEARAKSRHKGTLVGMFVHPDARGQGVGAKLMAAIIAVAREKVEQVHLCVVTENAAAIALYEKFGFVKYGLEPRALKRPDGYSDEWLMVLML